MQHIFQGDAGGYVQIFHATWPWHKTSQRMNSSLSMQHIFQGDAGGYVLLHEILGENHLMMVSFWHDDTTQRIFPSPTVSEIFYAILQYKETFLVLFQIRQEHCGQHFAEIYVHVPGAMFSKFVAFRIYGPCLRLCWKLYIVLLLHTMVYI
jgi:hypothetical protein